MLLRLARAAFLAMIVSLIWMKYPVMVGTLPAIPADFLFLLTFALWIGALAARQATFRWHPAYWLLLLYFAAMAVSALVATDARLSGIKLLSQIYLLALPVLTYNLIDSVAALRRLFRVWIAAAAVLGLLGTVTVLLFPLLGDGPLLDPMLHHFGTLRAGPYPRLELTFLYPALLVSYLAVSLMILLISRRLGWIERRPALAIGAGVLIAALFALSPGLGGLLFMVGVWMWAAMRAERPRAAVAALVAGIAAGAGAVLVAAVTPIIHSTAPFLIHIPGLPVLAPSVRLMGWIEALQNIAAHPLIGRGIGADAVFVDYQFPDGSMTAITDAHNSFLNLAVQCGLVGLAALLAILVYAARQARPEPFNLVRFGLALAFLSGIAVQGLVGSFEDARHLWIVFGLMLVADRLWPRRGEMVPVAGIEPATP